MAKSVGAFKGRMKSETRRTTDTDGKAPMNAKKKTAKSTMDAKKAECRMKNEDCKLRVRHSHGAAQICRPGIATSGRKPRRAFVVLVMLLCSAIGLFSPATAADTIITKEYQIKAAFLYNFSKFVEWPAGRFADDSSPIIIGILGASPFGSELEKTVKGRTVNQREIMVKSVTTAEEAACVAVLYVAPGAERRFEEIAVALEKAPVLTVADSKPSAGRKKMILFVMEADKVRFDINVAPAEKAGLKISAQLQKLARAVDSNH